MQKNQICILIKLEKSMKEHDQRIYKSIVNINYDSTRQFFSQRAEMFEKVGKLSVTMYQDNNPDLTKLRDEHERSLVTPLLGLTIDSKVLDIGCGVGRWGFHLVRQISLYVGTDFCPDLIEIAKKEAETNYKDQNVFFQTISCTEITAEKLIKKPPFNLIIIAGLFVYLNDTDCMKLLTLIPKLTSKHSTIYIREPIAFENRLTLQNYFSNELNTNYNAIYRTEQEYFSFLSDTLFDSGFKISHSGFLFPEELENRAETKQRYYILKN